MENFLNVIKHPMEGCAYLIYAGLFFRWRFPKRWNQLLKRLASNKLSS
ncbi:hypothetical protein EV11_1071 [Prochlorococcus sp. SS52]|uniref:Uncharacterized protein n=1 Tax=Prochlorococcus marinus (strain SARG / CCMP1375 / SS120) TaxID=167539 RepID=Q7VCM7_PROMA|nr:Predicted protein [Prochlorococcus marinus subsp. marinus str. CCMP1375]KGG22543.1 hypothetical protein EV08_0058 [Prochlorococcus marinus str. SS2]KGG35797.1 hypothetical protein EV11_1071 [Prochlorococcus sp. SS52]